MEYINYQTQDQWQGPTSQQSPIDIVLEQTTPRPLADQPLTVSFVGDQALTRDPRSSGDQFIGAGTLTLGNHHYHFLRLHFHDHSEHLFDGQRQDAEVHFVYQDDQGQTLVLAMLGIRAADGEAGFDFAPVINGQAGAAYLNQFFANNQGYFNYTGSLTTPPLSPDVTWVVLDAVHPFSSGSLALIHDLFANNYRAPQPITVPVYHYYESGK
ncbi:carbonic anhydrase family protein [Limosilactobacillus fermentum]|uniref:carbonic anhydrase family protein n=1 Tax=Limosilactobacillus fermentum TaxID=1613 RepID=UPI0030F31AD2